jgi:hypothetical protein
LNLALNLTRTSTDIADPRRSSRLAARAIAGIAENRRVDGEGLLNAKNSLGKIKVNAKKSILTALGAGLRTSLPAATKE